MKRIIMMAIALSGLSIGAAQAQECCPDTQQDCNVKTCCPTEADQAKKGSNFSNDTKTISDHANYNAILNRKQIVKTSKQ